MQKSEVLISLRKSYKELNVSLSPFTISKDYHIIDMVKIQLTAFKVCAKMVTQ